MIKDIVPKLKTNLDSIKFKISEQNLTNMQLVGDYIVNDYSIKPKKSLIIVIGFIRGFIFSIFIVFFIQFVDNFRKKEHN